LFWKKHLLPEMEKGLANYGIALYFQMVSANYFVDLKEYRQEKITGVHLYIKT
jgi:hypothetical protein